MKVQVRAPVRRRHHRLLATHKVLVVGSRLQLASPVNRATAPTNKEGDRAVVDLRAWVVGRRPQGVGGAPAVAPADAEELEGAHRSRNPQQADVADDAQQLVVAFVAVVWARREAECRSIRPAGQASRFGHHPPAVV